MLTVQNTTYLSLFIQGIAFLISLFSLQLPLQKDDLPLRPIMFLESIVQAIEFMFYTWFIYYAPNIVHMASFRYYDWFITTPTMLLSMILYYHYLTEKETFLSQENQESYENTWTFINENSSPLVEIFFYNAMMLLMGYLQEMKWMPLWFTNPVGFFFFFMTFYKIYKYYVEKAPTNQIVFWITFFVWSLYGIAAMLNPIRKNIMYNMLDLVSKNFYGIFIAMIIWYQSVKK